ncbi:MAG: FliH/SctL family protein [Simkaniaceae bacterium]
MKLFSMIKKGDVHLEHSGKILKSASFEEVLSGKAIIEEALKDVEAYKRENEEECRLLREKAKEEGFQEGLKQLNEKILKLDDKIRQVHHEMNQWILPLALKAAKKILGRELEMHSEAIVDIVLQALKPVKDASKIKILVSKEDLETLENQKAQFKNLLEHVDVLKIEERSDLDKGDCVIETEGGIINASLENQWRALEAAFETHLKQKP